MTASGGRKQTFAEYQLAREKDRAVRQQAFVAKAEARGGVDSFTARSEASFAEPLVPSRKVAVKKGKPGASKGPVYNPYDARKQIERQFAVIDGEERLAHAAEVRQREREHREEHRVEIAHLVEMLHRKIVERTKRASDQYREAFRVFGAPVERITFDAFRRKMRMLGLIATDGDLRRLFDYLDEDGSGDVDFEELVRHVMPPDLGYDPWAVHKAYSSEGAYITKAMTMKIPDLHELPSQFNKVELSLGDFTGLIQRKLLSRIRVSKDCYREAFRYFGNPSRGVSYESFVFNIRKLGITVPDNVLRSLFRLFDEDNSGSIDFPELIRHIINYEPPPMRKAKPTTWDPVAGKYVWAGRIGSRHDKDGKQRADDLLAAGDRANAEWEADWRRQRLNSDKALHEMEETTAQDTLIKDMAEARKRAGQFRDLIPGRRLNDPTLLSHRESEPRSVAAERSAGARHSSRRSRSSSKHEATTVRREVPTASRLIVATDDVSQKQGLTFHLGPMGRVAPATKQTATRTRDKRAEAARREVASRARNVNQLDERLNRGTYGPKTKALSWTAMSQYRRSAKRIRVGSVPMR